MPGDRTILTIRFSCHTDVSAMRNNDMAESRPVSLRDYVGQIEFQLYRIAVLGEPQSPRQTNDVRVAGDAGDAEGVAQDAIGRFPSHPGKGQQLLHRVGNGAVVVLDDSGARAFDIEGLVAIESRGSDVRFDLFQIGIGPVVGRGVLLEQLLCHHVDPFIRALRRENRGDQQFQRIHKTKGNRGFRIGFLQYGPHLLKPFSGLFLIDFDFLGLFLRQFYGVLLMIFVRFYPARLAAAFSISRRRIIRANV